jgi:hypothetical protein
MEMPEQYLSVNFFSALIYFNFVRSNLIEEVKEARGLFCLLTDKIDAEVLDAAPNLRGAFLFFLS